MPRWPEQSLEERFLSKVQKTATCWLWLGAKNPRGYGTIGVGGNPVSCHRLSWKLFCSPITSEQHVLHRCDVRNCVNPGHLFLGDQHSNVLDMHKKGRAAPKKGSLHGRAKITEEQAVAIRSDPRSQSQIAKAYSVGQSTVSRIKRLENWSHA